jgi:hypothetical protein
MNAKLLVEGIMQQTIALIAQLSTAAGLRAPLSNIADRVFVDLAREIEAQGVGRKVVADMFGMALRTYQKRVQRLSESSSLQGKTLWQAVLDELRDGPATRRRLRERFEYDGEREVGAVLNDLLNSGLIYCSGRGDAAIFGLTSAKDKQILTEQDDADTLASMLWLAVHAHEPVAAPEVLAHFSGDRSRVQRALDELIKEGIVQTDADGLLRANALVIPLNSEQGWETAVLDHFRAVTNAVAAKLRQGRPQAQERDVTGGATLRFQISPEHPEREAVLALLQKTRTHANELWAKVRAHNDQFPIADDASVTVTFYFGQNVNPNPSVIEDLAQ